jgi:hypothetical protein
MQVRVMYCHNNLWKCSTIVIVHYQHVAIKVKYTSGGVEMCPLVFTWYVPCNIDCFPIHVRVIQHITSSMSWKKDMKFLLIFSTGYICFRLNKSQQFVKSTYAVLCVSIPSVLLWKPSNAKCRNWAPFFVFFFYHHPWHRFYGTDLYLIRCQDIYIRIVQCPTWFY